MAAKLFIISTLLSMYLTQRKEYYLDINYILLFCKEINNGGKEVNFDSRKAQIWWPAKDDNGTFQMCNFLPSVTLSWPWRRSLHGSTFLKLRTA